MYLKGIRQVEEYKAGQGRISHVALIYDVRVNRLTNQEFV